MLALIDKSKVHPAFWAPFIAFLEGRMGWPFLKRGAALKHGAARVLFAGILVAIVPVALQAETANDIAFLKQQVVQLYGQGKYAEAAALAR